MQTVNCVIHTLCILNTLMQIFYIVFELNEYGFLGIEALQYAAAQYFCQALCAAAHGFLHTKKRRFIKIRALSYFAILINKVYRIFLNVLINIGEIRYLKFFQKSAGLMTPIVVWCLAWKEVKIVNILEKLYYGSIHPHEHALWNGGNNSELTENAIRHEKNLRAALTEHQKGLLEQFEKAEAEISDKHELQAFTTGFRLAARLMMEVYEYTPELES